MTKTLNSNVEERYKVIGVSSAGRRLSLAITIRENKKIRVIMARDQSRKERESLKIKLGGEKNEKT